MKITEIRDGGYFKIPGEKQIYDLIGRRYNDGAYFFDYGSTYSGNFIFDTIEEIEADDVESITFQEFLQILAIQCAHHNAPVEEINLNLQSEGLELSIGQFVFDVEYNNVGRVFPQDTILYLTKENAGFVDFLSDNATQTSSFVPISIHQATLFLLKQYYEN
jgi:hypothetical protein